MDADDTVHSRQSTVHSRSFKVDNVFKIRKSISLGGAVSSLPSNLVIPIVVRKPILTKQHEEPLNTRSLTSFGMTTLMVGEKKRGHPLRWPLLASSFSLLASRYTSP